MRNKKRDALSWIFCVLAGVNLSAHRQLWYWEDEAAAPFSNAGVLRNDFVAQIPRKDKEEVGLGLPDSRWREDGDSRPRSILSLFVRVSIDDVIEKIGPNSTIIEEGVTIAMGTITGNRLAVSLRLNKKA